MAHQLSLFLFFCAAAGSSFNKSKPILLVSDGFHNIEAQVLQVIGQSHHAVSFARFARSATGALEAAYAQAFGKNISLSEQQLMDSAGAFNNFGCKGGLLSHTFQYIKYNGGLDTEEAYPYIAADGVCKFSAENVGFRVLDSVNITLRHLNYIVHI
ncbi:unnamed protein product [Lupinus luteus]|uniref:Peptidase C1A papain C-terminal domain-containing protein n=1 Tax=Lupinus luteus TaxID=3873 RepID=A0AAV1Y9Q3_LUPLU